MGRALTKIGVLICFLFFRLIDSQSLTILCGGKDRRYRFAQEAIREGWIKEIKLEERERTTHRMTLYAITKQGIRHLRDNLPGSFLDFLSDSMLRSMAIFDKDEYSNMARKRIADTSAAMIMAVVMGGNIPEEVFTRRYSFGQSNSGGMEEKGIKTLADYIQQYFSHEDSEQLTLFYQEGSNISFYDGAYVKQAAAGTRNPKAARDFYKGRQIGLFQSEKQALLTYSAPFFGMGWSKWQSKPEFSAIINWHIRYASQGVRYSRQYNGLLIVSGPRQFANLYKDVDHARKEDELLGGSLNHLYLAEHSAQGVWLLQWLLSYSDEEIEENCASFLLSKNIATRNEHPSRNELRLRDLDGNEAMCGYHLDVKRMLFLDRWARRHPEKRFTIYCTEDQSPYYEAIMPENVRCVVVQGA